MDETLEESGITLPSSLNLKLPFPPSINSIYERKEDGHVCLTKAGKLYHGKSIAAVYEAYKEASGWYPTVKRECPVEIYIVAHFPNRRRRDLDNLLKTTLEVITRADLWRDNSQVVSIGICRGEDDEVGKGGLDVRIRFLQN